MDASEAREHLELVERIIAQSAQRLHVGAEFFLVWGLFGATCDGLFTAAESGSISTGVTLVAYAVLLLAAVAFSVLRARYYRECGERMSLLQREYLNVLWLTIALATVATFTTFNIFSSVVARGSLWSFAEAIVLFYVGMHGNRRAQIGGIVILASLIAANFVPFPGAGWILAAGVLLGYAGFGAAELIARE